MARVGVDCDGVLANFIAAFLVVLHRLYPEHPQTEANWTQWDGTLVSNRETKKVWAEIKATENFWLGVPAHIDDVGDLARWLFREQGQDVWIVTSRAKGAGMTTTKQTQLWLDSCGIKSCGNYLGVITVPDSDNKVDICSRLDIDWMIDDKVETIESMDRFPYLHAALLDRPWNQGAKVKWRVKTVGEFLRAIR
jgi:hypothetical protein